LGNVRLYRELKYQEAIYTAMLQQFQVARADEARDGPLIQQVDVAVAPDRKSKPARAMIVLGAAAAGLMLGLLVAFTRRAIRNGRENPQSAESWRALMDAWSLRRRPARATVGQEPS
jgi:tyrosine-protein kinase Etk/Wzc